jgi:quinol monooxygenase YgiN
MNVLPNKQKEVVQTLLSMIDSMRKEKGCLSYDVFYDMEDVNIHSLIEEWETREDLNQHLMSKKFKVLLGIDSLLDKPSKIQIHTISHSEGIETINSIRSKNT